MKLGAYSPLTPYIPPADGSGRMDKAAQSDPLAAEATNRSGDPKADKSAKSSRGVQELTPEERRVINELQARDTQVRAHEMAHLAAAGGIATGGASYTYQRGPDGRMYAVGGEVPISVSGGRTPEETVQKMRQVAAAAMAPADPSPQDYAVAASARQKEMKALAQMKKEQMERLRSEGVQNYIDAQKDTKPGGTLEVSA